jgi:hypothetical protein
MVLALRNLRAGIVDQNTEKDLLRLLPEEFDDLYEDVWKD